jgi:hypothetical protein
MVMYCNKLSGLVTVDLPLKTPSVSLLTEEWSTGGKKNLSFYFHDELLLIKKTTT